MPDFLVVDLDYLEGMDGREHSLVAESESGLSDLVVGRRWNP